MTGGPQQPLEQTSGSNEDDGIPPWRDNHHPLVGVNPDTNVVHTPGDQSGPLTITPAFSPQEVADRNLEIPPLATTLPAAPEIPAPVREAIASGAPIRFSAPGENQQANREPDFYFTPEGTLVANPKATPSADGSINIEIQNADQANNKSLRDAITHQTEMQKEAAKDMIRLWQKDHPGQPIPSWMTDLANARPNLPDFVPFNPQPNAPVQPPPENGFVPRGVSGGGGGGGSRGGGSGDGGFSGFAGNGGFDSQGNFKGSGGAGDGSIPTGGTSSQGKPLGEGETVQAKQLFDYFKEHGFTDAQASGILGNIQTESSFKTDAYNKGEGAIGLCQWEGPRRVALEAFAADQGKPVTDWRLQADFIMHEFATTEKKAFDAIKATDTPQAAALAFQSKYERSAAFGDRGTNAAAIYENRAQFA